MATIKNLYPWRLHSSHLPCRHYRKPIKCHSKSKSNASDVRPQRSDDSEISDILPAWAGWLGSIAVGIALASAEKADDKSPLPSKSSPSYEENAKKEQRMSDENAKKEQQRIEELLRSKGMKRGLYPRISVASKGQKVSIKFLIPPGCEVSQLIGNLVSSLGLKVEGGSGGSDMLLRASESAVTWQLTLTRPGKQVQGQKDLGQSKDINAHDGDLCILISGSLNSEKLEIEFIKQGSLSSKELEAFVSVLGLAGGNLGQNCSFGRKPQEGAVRVQSADKLIARLESMGVKIYGLDVSSSDINTSWGNLVGYDQQKREIEDTVLLALRRPEVYDEITHGTRRKFESNRPRAVLFDGPPGMPFNPKIS
ncbi:hypothetical protein CFP56_016800 [Quercus suber]|uniref:Uncharacterized protein n=1 Tax=Quercus suber TaxID=58331 RepID=A0AAW0KNT8_QUESU